MSVGPTVLIVRFSALGDVILTTPVMRALKSALPEAQVTFVTKEPYRELLEAQSTIDRVVALEPGESVRNLAQRIGPRFDLGFDLQGSLRSLLLRRYIGADWKSSAKPRLDRFRSIWLGRAPDTTHIVDRHLATVAGITGATADKRPVLEYPESDIGPSDRDENRRIALAPGAAHRNKKWATGHWFELATALTNAGWSPVMIGLERDSRDFDGIAAEGAWHLSLPATVALVAGCRAAVTHDSGIMHVAGAVDTPVVAMFGPTSPDLGFRPMGSRNDIVEQKLPCRPCSAFGASDCAAGHHRCLQNISAGDIQAALERIV